jgi:hypothetical protein
VVCGARNGCWNTRVQQNSKAYFNRKVFGNAQKEIVIFFTADSQINLKICESAV